MITVLVILIRMRTMRKILTRVWTKNLWLPKKLNNSNGNGSNPDMIQSEMVLMMKPHIMKMWKIKGIYLFNIITYLFYIICMPVLYSKALRCTFFGEWKNSCSSKFVQLGAFSDCLWRGLLILMYCDLLTKSWFPN